MKDVTLEMSLKPFKKTDDKYIKDVFKKMFTMWKPLCDKASESVSVLLFSSDGSEILDYKGNLDESFEWAKYFGFANHVNDNAYKKADPDGVSIARKRYNYIENPPVMTYGILKKIVKYAKEVGSELLGKTIKVGTIFDPGPEFAISDFKYKRHNEICMGNTIGKSSMVCAYAKLHADNVPYAGFPNGIPEGLEFGTFFGRQSQHFLTDLGFDYLWLSNGVGFGRETWSTVGAVFDGKKFDCSNIDDVKKDVFNFWKLFRNECPDFPVQTRGTNMSMGIDMATDGVPLKDIYNAGLNITPPPNSPWAALDSDFGLELMGHMSRIADLPGDDYLFRYYLHDPWWINSPWYDRYNSQPHDIYLPMALTRIDENGKTMSPTQFNILSIDNSFGDMPESCVYEPLGHMLRAFKDVPDEPSTLVWAYHFDEYSKCDSEFEAKKMFFGDWYIRGAINNGFPLSSVVSDDNFVKQDKSIYRSSILVSDIPRCGSEFEKNIIEYVKNGGRVIFYGNPTYASEEFKNIIGVKITDDSVSGVLDIEIEGESKGKTKHNPLLSCDGINTEATDIKNAFAFAGGKTIATQNGNVIWLRGTCSCDYKIGKKLLTPHCEYEYFIGERLTVKALARFGYEIEFEKKYDEKLPVIMFYRHNNAYMFSTYLASPTVKTRFKFPFGAPVIDGYTTVLEDGYATYNFPPAEHRECRVFVEQKEGVIRCRNYPPTSVKYRRRVMVTGLENATVRFLAESYCKDDVNAILNCKDGQFINTDKFEGGYVTIDGVLFYEARNVTGEMVFSMPYKEQRPNFM